MKVGDVVTVHEVIERRDMTCELHHRHRRVGVVRTFQIEVVETRKVRRTWEEGWAGRSLPLADGFRGVDEGGTEWFRDWNGIGGESASDCFIAEHHPPCPRRYAEIDYRGRGPRRLLYEGWIAEEA